MEEKKIIKNFSELDFLLPKNHNQKIKKSPPKSRGNKRKTDFSNRKITVIPGGEKKSKKRKNIKINISQNPGKKQINLWRCPLCREKVCSRTKEDIEEHYKKTHPSEWWNINKEDYLKRRREQIRPIIFLGGSPGSGKRR